ncbi:MAG: 2-oxo acid dehydrogenase subunit E2 [Anaerolineae bacterium]|nr:2-oxo acid dehydrogenase subunit E2 [Anaerolineae bacterium]
MATEFFIPKLGQTVEEVTLIKWLVEDGTKVKRGQEILEVETDKAIFPVEANGKGTLHIGPFLAGQVVPVLTVVAIIGSDDDTFEGIQATQEPVPAAVEAPVIEHAANPGAFSSTSPTLVDDTDRKFSSPRARKTANELNIDISLVPATGAGGVRVVEADVLGYKASSPKITPVARNAAQQVGLDLATISGSGLAGKIVKADVESAAANIADRSVSSESIKQEQAVLADAVSERIPLVGIRKIIAERMAQSVHTTARVTLVMDVDATDLVNARERMKARYAKDWGFAPGYNDLLAKIVAHALRKFPYMNARLTENNIEYLSSVNLGMAVDTERGLLVPVIRDADQKSLQAFGTEFRSMVDRARNGRALPDDLSGGTFTITNLGMYDVDAFTPVINLPEAAILGVGKIAPKPVVVDGEIQIRQMWTLSLVFDHRLVDGAPAARFLQFIKQVIEDPYLLLA